MAKPAAWVRKGRRVWRVDSSAEGGGGLCHSLCYSLCYSLFSADVAATGPRMPHTLRTSGDFKCV